MGTDHPLPIEEIRERAYDLWERNHRPDGLEIEFWLAAERELKAERADKGQARGTTVRKKAKRPTDRPAHKNPAPE